MGAADFSPGRATSEDALNDTNESPPYAVEQDDGKFAVVSATGMNILQCSDRRSAEHYVDLLNKAYRAGYKAGYRAARST